MLFISGVINISVWSEKSPNAFLSTSLNKNDVQKIAEAGGYAPIFGKLHFTVINDLTLIDTINTTALEMMKHSGNDFAEKMANTPGYNAVRNAQSLIVISSPASDDPNAFTMANAACAAENMLLAATELGIGSRFMMGPVMALSQEPVKSRISLPEGFVPLVIVALGHIEEVFEERNRTISTITFVD